MKRHTILFSFLGVLALSAFNGCGDDKKAEDPDKYPALGQFCNAIADAQCAPEVVTNCSIARETCIGSVQNDCASGDSDITKNFDRSQYDPKKAEPCVAAVQAAFTDAKLALTELATIEKACAPTFSLKAAVGFQCKNDFDCTSTDLKCFFDAAGAGACQVAVKVEGGSDCGKISGAVCPDGKYCFTSTTENFTLCKDKEPVSAECGIGTRECAANGFCQLAKDPSGTPTRAGTCIGKYSPGTLCGADQECETGRCGLANTAKGQVGKCLNNIIFSGSEPYCENFQLAARNEAPPGCERADAGRAASETRPLPFFAPSQLGSHP